MKISQQGHKLIKTTNTVTAIFQREFRDVSFGRLVDGKIPELHTKLILHFGYKVKLLSISSEKLATIAFVD